MIDKLICIHCLNEINPTDTRCPHCGNGTMRSKRFFDYVKRIEKGNGSMNAERYLFRRVGISPSTARKALSVYYSDKGKGKKPELNAVVKRIRVEKLFKYLDYDIDFNTPTSIIIAPNGFGKTTIFNFVNFILNPDLDIYAKYVKGVPFSKFEITLKNDVTITFEKGKTSDSYRLSASNVKEPKDIIIPIQIDDDVEDDYEDFEEEDEDRPSNPAVAINAINELLREAGISSEVFFIKTSRAFLQPELMEDYNSRRSGFDDEAEKPANPITACNDELFKLIVNCRNEYQKLVEKAKIEVPDIFLNTTDPFMSYSEFKKEWNDYNEQLNKLIEFGLIDKANAGLDLSKLSEEEYFDKMRSKGLFLSVYVSQYKETLEPFKELWDKMSIFKSIIDERNRDTGKRIQYTSNGIEYFNGSEPVKLEYLSSGEKNDFIMFFDLVFRTRQGTIVLIDEPEISLHINWQERFIDNVARALSNKKCQIIISTHSPDIISTHDDLLAEIKIHNGLKD